MADYLLETVNAGVSTAAYVVSPVSSRISSFFGDEDPSARFEDPSLWPEAARANANILTPAEVKLIALLLSEQQHHLLENWDAPGINDEQKHAFLTQVKVLHESYNAVGGLAGYLRNARNLLRSSRAGENPMAGWRPEVPTGVVLEPLSEEYIDYEGAGLSEVGACGFVLVAGGLGERLGYNGIKVELPVETTTKTCYMELYCQQILAMQHRFKARRDSITAEADKTQSTDNIADSGLPYIPLAIMVSDDTASKTLELLEARNYFGLEKEQVTIMKQEKVAALIGNDAHICLAKPYEIDAKPHGHGDVHALMHSTGTAQKWLKGGVRWIVFFQDTNGLAFTTLPAMLGVSKKLNLEVNSLAIPRVAKQAIGAITKLVHEDGVRTMTVNVEYNQLDPLLRATVAPQGDVNDPSTGVSPYPGNINQLLFSLEPYVANLEKTRGIMAEFVNPKYADETKTVFKKPTRLECMMQDYPKILSAGSKVGFTSLPAWICFSPCKNNSADAAVAAASGVPAGSAFTAESDQYFAQAEILRKLSIACPSDKPVSMLGISAIPGPRIVIRPTCAIFPTDFKRVFTSPENVSISPRSTLIVEGNVEIHYLHLDGALKLVAVPGTKLVVIADGVRITNAGTKMVALPNPIPAGTPEVDAMRGYTIDTLDISIVSTQESYFNDVDEAETEYVYTGRQVVLTSNYDPRDAALCTNNCFSPLDTLCNR